MELKRNWKPPKSPEKVEAFSERLKENNSVAFSRETTRIIRKTTSADYEKEGTPLLPNL